MHTLRSPLCSEQVERKFATYNLSGSGSLSESELLVLGADLGKAVSLDEVTDVVSDLQGALGTAVDLAAFAAWWAALAPTSKAKAVVVSDWFLMRQVRSLAAVLAMAASPPPPPSP